MPTLRQLRQFIVAAEVESLSKAAALLGTVPSAVSAQIGALEKELDCVLFRRDARGVHPTEQGLELKGHARRILEAVRELGEASSAAAQAISGRIQLGLLPWMCASLLPPLLEQARLRFPRLELVVREGRSEALADALAAGELNLAALHGFHTRPEHRAVKLCEEALWLAGPVGASGLAGASVGLSDVLRLPLVVGPQHDVLAQAARTEGVPLIIVAMVDSEPGTTALVAAGRGYALLPLPSVRDAVAAGRIGVVRVSDCPGVPVLLARSTRHHNLAAASAMARLLRELVAETASMIDSQSMVARTANAPT